jgi:hypothetical protein
MQGAVKKLDSSSTNTERIEGTCKIVEELFRTLGITLYTGMLLSLMRMILHLRQGF